MLPRGLVTSWRDRAVLATVLALFVVPAAILLLAPKPGRFGFQMYSGYGVVTATWTDRDGTTHELDLEKHTANPRGEVDWPAFAPELLCERLPAAARVEVRRTVPGGPERRAVTC